MKPFDRFPELTALNHYRMEQNLSYRALADLVGIPFKTLHSLLTAANPRPYDRTLYRIRRVVERLGLTEATPPRRRRSREATL